jgi:GntR family transcriptional regulator, arabinose operon transcriptional repressor
MKAPARSTQPLYQRVIADITAQIDEGNWRPGDRLPSEHALCERYQVSQITVRRALRELAHAERVYSHHGLGWFISEAPVAVERGTDVTLILPGLDAHAAQLVRHLNDELVSLGALLRLSFTEGQAEAEAAALGKAVAQGASALILAVSGPERRLAQRYARLVAGVQIPILLLYQEIIGLSLPAVILDEGQCMSQVTRHLLGLGHRRIAYAGVDPALVEGQRRYRGFATTLWEQGLELPMDWVFSGGLTSEAETRRFGAAFQQDLARPTGLVCASDMLAAQALYLLHDLDLQCPEDVAIVSLGDREFAPLLSTPLTTFRPDLVGLARAAAHMAFDLIAGREVANVRVTGELIQRASCGVGLRKSA